MKKLLFTLIFALTAVTQAAAYDFEVDGIYYNKNGTNATVTYKEINKHGYRGKVVIPETVSYGGKNYTVTAIADNAFYSYSNDYRNALTEITLPNTLISIGQYAFGYCEALKEVLMPNSVTSISYLSFAGCSNLSKVELSNALTSISYGAFMECYALKQIDIPLSVKSIGTYAFSGCGFADLIIPNSITEINMGAFGGCKSLESVSIGNSVITIAKDVFALCDRLSTVVFESPSQVSTIGDYAFYHTNLTNVIIPNSVTSIAQFAFGATPLASVTIGNGVTFIGKNAFDYCYDLRSITCLAGTPPEVEDLNCFFSTDPFNCYELATLYVPKESLQAFKIAPIWSNFVNIETIGSSVSQGDVNGDGEVGLTDVNCLIDLILTHQVIPSADVNDDGEMNVADVNALISLILKS